MKIAWETGGNQSHAVAICMFPEETKGYSHEVIKVIFATRSSKSETCGNGGHEEPRKHCGYYGAAVR